MQSSSIESNQHLNFVWCPCGDQNNDTENDWGWEDSPIRGYCEVASKGYGEEQKWQVSNWWFPTERWEPCSLWACGNWSFCLTVNSENSTSLEILSISGTSCTFSIGSDSLRGSASRCCKIFNLLGSTARLSFCTTWFMYGTSFLLFKALFSVFLRKLMSMCQTVILGKFKSTLGMWWQNW